MTRISVSLFALLPMAGLSAAANAGTYMESVITNSLTPQKTTQTAKMWVDPGRFRMEMNQGQQVQIYNKQVLYSLNVPAKTYSKLDQKAAEETMRALEQSKKQLQDMLPPEARGKTQESKTSVDRTLKPTNRTETAAGQSCKVWEVMVSGVKSQEVCVVPLASIPNSKEMVGTMKDMANTFKAFGSIVDQSWNDIQTTNGIPVITRVYMNGKLAMESKTTAIRSASTTDTMFAVPAGFKETALGSGI